MGGYTASSMAQEVFIKEIHFPLTHLCFADDLLIFTDGSLSSFQGVLKVLRDFEAFLVSPSALTNCASSLRA